MTALAEKRRPAHQLRLLTATAIGDVASRRGWPRRRDAEPAADGLERAIAWLCRTHDVTGRQGSSKGFHLLRGWLPAYPETTGYVLGTLLEYAARRGDGDEELRARAREMGDWEIAVQNADGGVMEGTVDRKLPSVAFNTGMVLHGWLDLVADNEDRRYHDAAARASAFLTATQSPDGAWRDEAAYRGLATTYHSRVAWALLRQGLLDDDSDILAAGRRNLDWTLDQQRPNGWFASCNFGPGWDPNTHGIAYTLRGLLEGGLLLDDPRYLEAVVLTSEQLIRKLEVLGTLPATFDAEWRPTASYVCLTGLVQLGDIWLKLAAVTGDSRWYNAGLKAIAQVTSKQERSAGPAQGALAGSYPIFGRYSPLQYPNWPTKFLADALLTLEASS
jgi:hypothetical protein